MMKPERRRKLGKIMRQTYTLFAKSYRSVAKSVNKNTDPIATQELTLPVEASQVPLNPFEVLFRILSITSYARNQTYPPVNVYMMMVSV